jgi:DNA primase
MPGANNWKPYYSKILDDFDTVIVLADGDNPGLEFGKKVSRELGNVNIIQMPDGHDVNSIVLQEGAGWLDDTNQKMLSQHNDKFWDYVKDNPLTIGIPVSDNKGLDLLSSTTRCL